jgi:hypothetical protein
MCINDIISKTNIKNIENVKKLSKLEKQNISNNKSYLDQKISRDDYVLIFEKIFEIYDISKEIKIDSV